MDDQGMRTSVHCIWLVFGYMMKWEEGVQEIES